jgi:hypothetical protein
MKKKFAIAKQNKTNKQNKQNGEGRRKTISKYTYNNNLTNLNAVGISLLLLWKKLCNWVREGGKTNQKKKKKRR